MRSKLLGCAFALVLGCGACGVPTEQRARVTPADDVPFDLLESKEVAPPDPSAEVPPPVADSFGAYFVRSGLLLEVPLTLPAPIRPEDAIGMLLRGPDPTETRRGLRTALAGDETLRSVESSAGSVTLDLGADFTSLAPREQLLGLAQMVLTLTTLRGIGSVTVLVEGKKSDVRVGDGSLRPGPVTRDDYASLIAP